MTGRRLVESHLRSIANNEKIQKNSMIGKWGSSQSQQFQVSITPLGR